MPDKPPYGLRRLNYIVYFGREPKLADLFAGYQFVLTKGQYDIYERLDAGAVRTGPPSPRQLFARRPSRRRRRDMLKVRESA